ncbi:MAG: FG-GAP-like repeat-containing protein, partial [Gemmataceae bacterium]|nr:FG-GAP-like repeat-containing protein [Gemmataceae bacterium]MDW8267125.1 FG-GAP-like repeat-containing protein [Gemmataceae bacterium]
PGSQTTLMNTNLVFSSSGGNAISISDIDAGSNPVQVSLSVTNGVLTLSGTTGLTFSVGDGTADATMTFTGTTGNINTALNGLVFTPTTGFGGTAVLTITTNDLGHTGSGGPLTDSDTVTITVINAPNGPPVNTVPGPQTINEDHNLVFSSANGNAISISDPDAGSLPVQVTLSVTAGSLSLNGTNGLTFSTGDGTADASMTFTGSIVNINAALNGLTFTPPPNFAGTVTLSLQTNDMGNFGVGGAQTDSDTVTINVQAVNDAPVNTVPGSQTVFKDTTLVFSTGAGNSISVADVDAGSNPVQVTLTVSAGDLTLGSTAGLSFSTGDGTADPTMTFSGTLSAVNAALQNLTFTPPSGFVGMVTLTVTSNDQGHTGAGGALSDTDSVTIQVKPLGAQLLVTGADRGGGPHVRVFDPVTKAPLFSFFAYSPGFTGGVRVAAGDVNGDGFPDIITGPGPGGGPHIRVFDGKTGVQLPGPVGSFMAFAPSFSGGVFVAAGDVDGDGRADLVVGADAGGGPHVKVFSGLDGATLHSFFAYGPGFTGGVRVAAGDVNGDGRADIIAGAGPGGGPHVLAFDGTNLAVLRSFFAYSPGFTGGVFVAAGDVTGDGRADIITGPGSGGGPHIVAVDGKTGTLLANFMAYPPGPFPGSVIPGDGAAASAWHSGARVAVADVDQDGKADFIVAPGPGRRGPVRIFGSATLALIDELFAYDLGHRLGIFVGSL